MDICLKISSHSEVLKNKRLKLNLHTAFSRMQLGSDRKHTCVLLTDFLEV